MNKKSQALDDVLKDWSLWPILNKYNAIACTFTQLEQGLTNENWLVTLPTIRLASPHDANTSSIESQKSHQEVQQQFVIRINATNAQALNINHQSEYDIVSHISALNLCPEVLYNEPNFKYWVRPYINGNTLGELQASNLNINDNLASVAIILKKAHHQIIKQASPSINIIERAEYFWQQILPKPSNNTAETLKLKQRLDDAFSTSTVKIALCHMDPNIHNWIKDTENQLHLIDWEYAGLGNPVWDLAVFSESAKLTKEEETQFLAHYGEYSYTELQHAKLQMEYLSILWFAVQENTDTNTLLCELKNLVIRAC